MAIPLKIPSCHLGPLEWRMSLARSETSGRGAQKCVITCLCGRFFLKIGAGGKFNKTGDFWIVIVFWGWITLYTIHLLFFFFFFCSGVNIFFIKSSEDKQFLTPSSIKLHIRHMWIKTNSYYNIWKVWIREREKFFIIVLQTLSWKSFSSNTTSTKECSHTDSGKSFFTPALNIITYL